MTTKWIDRYQVLVDNENLNTEQLKLFVGKRHNTAREFRINLVAKLRLEGIILPNNMLIPTELFLEEIGKDMNYFEQKMIQEAKINKYRREQDENRTMERT